MLALPLAGYLTSAPPHRSFGTEKEEARKSQQPQPTKSTKKPVIDLDSDNEASEPDDASKITNQSVLSCTPCPSTFLPADVCRLSGCARRKTPTCSFTLARTDPTMFRLSSLLHKRSSTISRLRTSVTASTAASGRPGVLMARTGSATQLLPRSLSCRLNAIEDAFDEVFSMKRNVFDSWEIGSYDEVCLGSHGCMAAIRTLPI